MSDSTEKRYTVEAADAYKAELDQIKTRRVRAGFEDNDEELEQSLAGLALSGGGIRSASFNLGLLQALHRFNALRLFDYLSTVSGGGYVGSYLSSLAISPKGNEVFGTAAVTTESSANEQNNHQSPEDAESANHTSLDCDAEADDHPFRHDLGYRQSNRVHRFLHGGRYLAKPIRALNRQLIGAFLMNLTLFSGLVMAATIVALLFRWLDQRSSMRWLSALGFQDDLARAFAPTAILFFCWFVSWLISYFRSGSRAAGRMARWFLVMLLLSLLVAMGGLLGTGEINLNRLSQFIGFQQTEALAANIKLIENYSGFVVAALLIVGLLPYLQPQKIIESGRRQKTSIERVTFWVASRALVVGIPLTVFWLIARENISRHNDYRSEFLSADVAHKEAFWHRVFFEATGNCHYWEDADSSDCHSGKKGKFNAVEPGNSIWKAAAIHMACENADVAENHIKSKSKGLHDHLQKVRSDRRALAKCMRTEPEDKDWTEFVKRLAAKEHEAIRQSILMPNKLASERNLINDDLILHQRWWYLMSYLVSGRENDVSQMVALSKESQEVRNRLFETISYEVLSDPAFYVHFEPHYTTYDEENLQRHKSMRNTLVKARAFEAQWKSLDTDRNQFRWDKALWQTRMESLCNKIMTTNRALLRIHYSNCLWKDTPVYASVVAAKDQVRRFWILGIATSLFLLLALTIDINSTSMHGFYRNQLARMWIDSLPGFGRNIPLTQLTTTEHGAPYHLISATLNLIGRKPKAHQALQEGFLFSQAYCGSDTVKYQRTSEFAQGKYDLANAMAISGAAVSPVQFHNPLVLLLLLLFNFRLGQWLPSTSETSSKITVLRFVIDILKKRRGDRRYSFVTDGGHYENLGLEQLLKRRCKLILVSDATCDPNFDYPDFTRVHERMRIQEGIRIHEVGGDLDDDIDFFEQRPKQNHWMCSEHFRLAQIQYPQTATHPAEVGYLIYVKPSFTGDESFDSLQYRRKNDQFPHDSTTNQFFPAEQFEAYRSLGFHIGQTLCQSFGFGDRTNNNACGSEVPLDVASINSRIPLVHAEKLEVTARSLRGRACEIVEVTPEGVRVRFDDESKSRDKLFSWNDLKLPK